MIRIVFHQTEFDKTRSLFITPDKRRVIVRTTDQLPPVLRCTVRVSPGTVWEAHGGVHRWSGRLTCGFFAIIINVAFRHAKKTV